MIWIGFDFVHRLQLCNIQLLCNLLDSLLIWAWDPVLSRERPQLHDYPVGFQRITLLSQIRWIPRVVLSIFSHFRLLQNSFKIKMRSGKFRSLSLPKCSEGDNANWSVFQNNAFACEIDQRQSLHVMSVDCGWLAVHWAHSSPSVVIEKVQNSGRGLNCKLVTLSVSLELESLWVVYKTQPNPGKYQQWSYCCCECELANCSIYSPLQIRARAYN